MWSPNFEFIKTLKNGTPIFSECVKLLINKEWEDRENNDRGKTYGAIFRRRVRVTCHVGVVQMRALFLRLIWIRSFHITPLVNNRRPPSPANTPSDSRRCSLLVKGESEMGVSDTAYQKSELTDHDTEHCSVVLTWVSHRCRLTKLQILSLECQKLRFWFKIFWIYVGGPK